VDCGRIAELLGGYRGEASRGALSTAAGRVAAHELVHALAPGRGHAHFGLMAPRFGRDALETEEGGKEESSHFHRLSCPLYRAVSP
jgi:hypothetical protein